MLTGCSERLTLARDRGERVLVFGDFDADGLTGLAIMTLALRRFGVEVIPYVPSRLDEGHGLSRAAIEAAAAGGRDRHRDRRLRLDERTGDRGRRRTWHRHDRDGPPSGAAGPPAGFRARQSPSGRRHVSRPAVGWQRRRVQGRASCSWRACPADRRPRSPSPTWRRSARWPMSRRSSARTARSRGWDWLDYGPRHVPGSRRFWSAHGSRLTRLIWRRSRSPSRRG